MPRTGDLIKVAIVPTAFGVGWLSRGHIDAQAGLRALVVWLALEFLIYPARYQWNDIRGFEADQRHAGGDRGRLPGPLRRRRSRVTSSALVAIVKVALAIFAGFMISRGTGIMIVVLTVAVFGLAALYEALRRVATGTSDAVPAEVTAGVLGIWLLIGTGYALRALAGLVVAGVDLTDPPLLLPSALVACWMFGIAWITSRWALEATVYASLRPGGALEWSVERNQAREHQLALVRWLPTCVPGGVSDLRRWPAVRDGIPTAPWTIAGVIACGASAAAGAQLADRMVGGDALVVIVAVGLAAGTVVQLSGRWRLVAVVGGALLVALGAGLTGVARPTVVMEPWLVIALAQYMYLRQDRASLGHLPRWGRRRSEQPHVQHVPEHAS